MCVCVVSGSVSGVVGPLTVLLGPFPGLAPLDGALVVAPTCAPKAPSPIDDGVSCEGFCSVPIGVYAIDWP